MEVTITSANCEVINSGLVTSFGGLPIDIAIPIANSSAFHLIFEFVNNESTKEPNLSVIPEDNTVKFILTNFVKPLGTGIKKPINFGEEISTGKQLYINFCVSSVGESAPTLNYTIYREKQGTENGK